MRTNKLACETHPAIYPSSSIEIKYLNLCKHNVEDGPEVNVIRSVQNAIAEPIPGSRHCPECNLVVPSYAQIEHSKYFCYGNRD